MDIITRSDAKSRELKTYFTGEPCRNGHVAYRYTQNGSCSDCVKAANSPILTPTQDARKEALRNLHLIKLRIDENQFGTMQNIAWAFASVRYPVLEINDTTSRNAPSKHEAGTCVYGFYIHPDDIQTVRSLSLKLCGVGFDARAALDQIYGKLGINNHSSIQTGQHLPPVRLERLDAPADPEQARQQSLKNYPGGVDPEEARRLAWEKWETFNKNHAATNKPGGELPQQP